VHEILGKFDLEIWRVAEFEEVFVALQFEEGQLVAGWRLVGAPGTLEAQLFIKGDRLIKIAYPDARV
jgi:hypothetical protein